MQDHYPTRTEDKPVVLPRVDPVVWTGDDAALPRPLNLERLIQYRKDGYLFLPSVFTPEEVARLNEELTRLRSSAETRARPEAIVEPSGEEVRSLFAVHRLSPLFARLARDPRLLNVARQVLGSEVYVHQSRINLKPGFRGEQFFWHSDFETWHAEDGMPAMRALSFSVLLTENNPHNGPLMVVPGSHRIHIGCVGRTPPEHYRASLRRQEYGVPDRQTLSRLIEDMGIVAPTGPAGSVLMFDCNTMHGSPGNLSPWPRSNAFYVYNSVENALVEPFCGMPPRPEFVASRDFQPLTALEGSALAGEEAP